jgi:tetratricopeptide (TPR) repeat protein
MRWIAAFLAVVGLLFVAASVVKRGGFDAPGTTDTTAPSADQRERMRQFWETYRQATELRIAGRSAEAADAYARALALNPGHQDALYYQGNMEFDLGRLADAQRAWRRLVDVDPSNARGHSQLGMLYSCVGEPAFLDLESAAAEFQRALEINREETGPLLQLGEIALLQGDLAQARSWFEKVVGSNFSSVEALFYLGYLAWKASASNRATEFLAAAAGHARPAERAMGVPGEGDTRAGKGPVAASPAPCRPMRAAVSDLGALAPDAVAHRMGPIYREFDALLESVRRKLPR